MIIIVQCDNCKKNIYTLIKFPDKVKGIEMHELTPINKEHDRPTFNDYPQCPYCYENFFVERGVKGNYIRTNYGILPEGFIND